jgi:hypothetical protein
MRNMTISAMLFVLGADSAAASARRAIALRRVGAAWTDIGVVATGSRW